MRLKKLIVMVLLTLFSITFVVGCTENRTQDHNIGSVVENHSYVSAKDVANYLRKYHKLPLNYITKSEAKEKGWNPDSGNLRNLGEEICIGGDRFGNREGKLPTKKGRVYYECDVNYHGGYRTKERIIYSNDGLIFYTNDHYNTFKDISKEDPN